MQKLFKDKNYFYLAGIYIFLALPFALLRFPDIRNEIKYLMITKNMLISKNYLILKYFFAFTQTEKKQGFNKGEFYRLGNSLKGSFYLNDSDYRFLIKAKIIKNYQTGTLENIYKSLEFLLGAGNFIFDNYDMTLNLVLKNTKTTQFLINLIFKNDILARPVGVGLNVILIAEAKCFGFSQNKANLGFGIGKFARIFKEDQ